MIVTSRQLRRAALRCRVPHHSLDCLARHPCRHLALAQLQVRGKKTTSTFKFVDVDKGLIPLEPIAQQHVYENVDGLGDIEGEGPKKTRKRKIKTSADIDETTGLPQGLIPLEQPPLEEEAPSYPTVVLQARKNMRKFENCVLLTRVGGFYELYFEHADHFAPLLNLKVAHKKPGVKANWAPVSMVTDPRHTMTCEKC